MPDDPLYGDRPKPPLVPMSNEQVVDFDLLRSIHGPAPTRRVRILGLITVGFLVVALVAVVYIGSARDSTVTHVKSSHALLVRLCSELRSDEAAYTQGSITHAELEHRLDVIGESRYSRDLASPAVSRLTTDVLSQAMQLADENDIGGPALDDAHHVCS